jgi:hypothetical protein
MTKAVAETRELRQVFQRQFRKHWSVAAEAITNALEGREVVK